MVDGVAKGVLVIVVFAVVLAVVAVGVLAVYASWCHATSTEPVLVPAALDWVLEVLR